jgi:protoheme IX farnesyltransferase
VKEADAVSVPLQVGRTSARLADYVALTKPRLNVLVVATSAAGYYLGATRVLDLWPMAQAVAGTALVAGGAAVLNQVYERDTDALMRRTRARPLPDGRVPPADARIFGLALALGGLALLAARASTLAALLAAATLIVYLVVYTPMKRHSRFDARRRGARGLASADRMDCFARLAVARGRLFAIVFLWQIPHFMAIAWMYRDDYATAGFPMLPVIDPEGRRAGRQAVIYAAALLPASLVPTAIGLSGTTYLAIALGLGIALLWLAVRFARTRSDDSARTLFLASIVYLPLIWIAMIWNKL